MSTKGKSRMRARIDITRADAANARFWQRAVSRKRYDKRNYDKPQPVDPLPHLKL
jgi:hypothetical protein